MMFFGDMQAGGWSVKNMSLFFRKHVLFQLYFLSAFAFFAFSRKSASAQLIFNANTQRR
jgi:hypothetical protein